ncbi:alcohol dehydrogenase catalytic domain-containing protein [Vampirovibrio chlorellavorus]|uniref:alcohol dehydrogenase catalytic domain-containing protein n=1 Tax=Vampirovibrio chlorellavorus TaxID=758823 RepID=UPI0026EE9B4E|nr:alcohol dehydrogenase catalytic domain-containing protein [Vampirovibrio chlorellavorus]
MQAATVQPDYQLALSELPIPAIPDDGALIRVLGCGLCGSDLDKVIHSKAQPGTVLGHEIVGIIEALAPNAPAHWSVGDRLVSAHHVPCGTCHYCLSDSESMCRQFKATNFVPGGFAQYLSLTGPHLEKTAFKVPSGITDAEASCVEPLACVLRGIRRGQRQHQKSVAVVGLGFIGLMTAQVYQNEGSTVYGIDLVESRLTLAQAEGFVKQAFHPIQQAAEIKETLTTDTPTGQVDTVFLSVVNNKTLDLALELVRDGGNIIVFTSGPAGTSVDPSRLYFREINLITTYSPALRDLKNAAELVFNRKIRLQPLLSHTLSLRDIQQGVDLYQQGQAIKVFIHMDGA